MSFDIRFEVVATIHEQKSGGAHRRGISTRLDDGEGQFQWWQNNLNITSIVIVSLVTHHCYMLFHPRQQSGNAVAQASVDSVWPICPIYRMGIKKWQIFAGLEEDCGGVLQHYWQLCTACRTALVCPRLHVTHVFNSFYIILVSLPHYHYKLFISCTCLTNSNTWNMGLVERNITRQHDRILNIPATLIWDP